MSTESHYPFTLGRSLVSLAQLEQARGNVETAWQFAHDGLDVLAVYGDRVGVASAIVAVAGLASARGKPELALRLLAASEYFHEHFGMARFRPEAEDGVHNLSEALGQVSARQAEECQAEGARLSLSEAVAYARRGRGERGRPKTGWASLTPAERKLVQLVVEGCTNSEIGARLFVSVNTVKKHLSNIYGKTNVDGRAQLAALAARHGV
jgi:DNA-binding CsgD family transcriptional regulator